MPHSAAALVRSEAAQARGLERPTHLSGGGGKAPFLPGLVIVGSHDALMLATEKVCATCDVGWEVWTRWCLKCVDWVWSCEAIGVGDGGGGWCRCQAGLPEPHTRSRPHLRRPAEARPSHRAHVRDRVCGEQRRGGGGGRGGEVWEGVVGGGRRGGGLAVRVPGTVARSGPCHPMCSCPFGRSNPRSTQGAQAVAPPTPPPPPPSTTTTQTRAKHPK